MKKLLRKLLSISAAFLMVASMFPTGTMYVNAEDLVITSGDKTKTGKIRYDKYWNSDGTSLWKVNGQVAFCIEADVGTSVGTHYTNAGSLTGYKRINGDAAKASKIAHIAYLGGNGSDVVAYTAAQMLIWQELGYNSSTESAAVNAKANEIKNKLNNDTRKFEGTLLLSDGKQSLLAYAKLASKTISVNVNKKSALPGVTDGNAKYSLAGAVFHAQAMSGSSVLAEMDFPATDANGNASITNWTVDSSVDHVQVREVSAPAAYNLDDTTYHSAALNNDSASFTFTDTPKNDPVVLKITKTNASVTDNPTSLEGTQFTVKYYANDDASGSPARTWVIQTKKIGNSYSAWLEEGFKVSGDEFFKNNSGVVVLPLGTITIQETKAATGYTLNGSYKVSENGTAISQGNANDIITLTVADLDNHVLLRYNNNSDAQEIGKEDKPEFGTLKVQKFDKATGRAETEGDAPDLTTTFHLLNNTGYTKSINGTNVANGGYYEFRTDANGYAEIGNIEFGKYTLVESAAPTGYTLDGGTTSADVTIDSDGKVVTLTNGEISDYPQTFPLNFSKRDLDKDAYANGDTNLSGTYRVVNASAKSVMVNGTEYAPNAEIMQFTTDEKGNFSTSSIFPYGSYRIDEVKAPTGYSFKGKVVNVGKADTLSTIVAAHSGNSFGTTFQNKVITGKFSITKVRATGKSDFNDPEKDVEFTAILDSKIGDGKTFASWDDAYKAIKAAGVGNDVKDANGNIILSNLEYAVVVTDENGHAQSGDLAYGTYTIKQTSHKEETHDITNGATFVVNSENQPVKNYFATNEVQDYYLHLVKKDAQTGKTVSLNSATFQIYKVDGDKETLVTQRVGLNRYSKFTTNSDGKVIVYKNPFTGDYADADDAKGSVTTPLKLTTGTYRIKEIATPGGYLNLASPLEITVKESTISEVDDENENIINVEISNNRILGELDVIKSIKPFPSDKSFINRKDLSGFGFELRAAEDIIDPADGSVITAKGDLAKTLVNSSYVKTSTLYADASGKVILSNIPLGKYVLSETVQPEGTVTNKETYDVDLTQKDQTNPVKAEVSISNDTTKISVSKKTVTGSDELKGASLSVTDENGNVVDSWTSTDKPHVIEGLTAGKTYTLTEDTSPRGYVKNSSVDFTVDQKDQQVTLVDTIERVAKIDENGNYVKGAVLQAVDADGNVLDTWTTGAHIVDLTEEQTKALQSGKEAIMTQDDGTTVVIRPVAKVTEKETTGKTTGTEDLNKDGYCEVKTEKDLTKITKPEVPSDGDYSYTAVVTSKDGTVSYVDIDLNGDETDHRISGLASGQKYSVKEVQTPDGFYTADDAAIAPTDDADHRTGMVDNGIHYQIAKVDDTTGEYVSGVTLKLTDITDAEKPVEVELPNNGVTTDKPFELDNKLIGGHKYELEESEYVAGYYKATSMQFTVPTKGTSDVTTITMRDVPTNVTVEKVDNHGTPVKGAKMQILDKDGKVVYEFTSTDDKNGTDITKYVKGGETYILREFEAPWGFEKIVDTEFMVTGTDEKHQVLVATDVRKTYYVSAVKVDAQNNSKLLKGAEITLFTKDGKVAKDVNGNDCVGVTDGKGTVTWNVEYNGDGTAETMAGYYVLETKAPQGYRINKNKFDVLLTEDYDFAAENPVKILVNDQLLPAVANTGDNNNLMIWMILIIAGIAMAGTVLVIKKRNA